MDMVAHAGLIPELSQIIASMHMDLMRAEGL